MKTLPILFILPILSSLSGCDDNSTRVTQLERRMAAAEGRPTPKFDPTQAYMPLLPTNAGPKIEFLMEYVGKLSEQIQALDRRLDYSELPEDETWTELNTTQKSYLPIKTRVGILFVALDNITPYLDGYRLTIRIGNPSSATLNGFQLSAQWGTNRQTFSHADKLSAGRWSKIEFIISPATVEATKKISVMVRPDKITLPEALP